MPRQWKPTPAQRLQMLRILWLTQFGSVAIFAVVCVILSAPPGGADFEPLPLLRTLLWIVGLALTLLSLWWRRSFAVSPSSPLFLFPAESSGADAQTDPVEVAASRLQTNCVIVWALSEGVAICGVVLALLTRNVSEFLPFAVVGVLLLYVHRPAAWPLDRVFRRQGPGGVAQ